MANQDLTFTIRGSSREMVAEVQKAIAAIVQIGPATEKSAAIASANTARLDKTIKSLTDQLQASTAAQEKTVAALGQLAGASEKAGAEVEKGAKRQGDALKNLAQRNAELEAASRQLAIGVATLAAPMVASTKAAIDYDQALRNVNSIAQLAPDRFRELHRSVLALSQDPNIVKGPTDLAKGLYDVYSVGYEGKEALDILRQSAIGATAGMTTTKVAANVLTSTLSSQIGGVHNAKEAMDALFQIVNKGKADFPELAAQIGTVFPVARQAGVTLQEVGAAFIVMNKGGFSAAEATTAITNLLREIVQPSEKAKKALGEHANILSIANLRAVGLSGVMQQLSQVFGGNTDRLLELIPEHRALNAALALGADNGRQFTQALVDMKHASDEHGAALNADGKIIEGTAAKLEKFRSEMERLAISLGDKLLPQLNHFVDFLNKHPDAAAMAIQIAAITVSVNQLGQAFRNLGGLKAFEWLTKTGEGGALASRIPSLVVGLGVGTGVVANLKNPPDPVTGMRDNGSVQAILPPELRAGNAAERAALAKSLRQGRDLSGADAATILGLQDRAAQQFGFGGRNMAPALPFVGPPAPPKVALPPPVETEAMKKARAELEQQIRDARAQGMPDETAADRLRKRQAEADAAAEKERQRVTKQLGDSGLKDEKLRSDALAAIETKRQQERKKALEEYQRDVEQEQRVAAQAMPEGDIEERRRKHVEEENLQYQSTLNQLQRQRASQTTIENAERQHNDRLFQIDQQAEQERAQRQQERFRGFQEALARVNAAARDEARKLGGSDESIAALGDAHEAALLKDLLRNVDASVVGDAGMRSFQDRLNVVQGTGRQVSKERLRTQLADIDQQNATGGSYAELQNIPRQRELLQMIQSLETSEKDRAGVAREIVALGQRESQIRAELFRQGQALTLEDEKQLAAHLQVSQELADQEHRIKEQSAQMEGPDAYRAFLSNRLRAVQFSIQQFSAPGGDTEQPETQDQTDQRLQRLNRYRLEELRLKGQVREIDKASAGQVQQVGKAQYDLARAQAGTDAERLAVDERELQDVQRQIQEKARGNQQDLATQHELIQLRQQEAQLTQRIEAEKRRPEQARQRLEEELQLSRMTGEQRRVREVMDHVAGEFGFRSIVEAEKQATPEILAQIKELASKLDQAYREMHSKWRQLWSSLAEDAKRTLHDTGTNIFESLFDGLLGGKKKQDLGKMITEQLRGLLVHSLSQIAMTGLETGAKSLFGGIFGAKSAGVAKPGDPNFMGPLPPGFAPGEKAGIPQIAQQVPMLSSALGGIINVFEQGKGDLGSVLGSLIQVIGSVAGGGGAGGIFGGVLSGIASIFSFDDPVNDAQARRWGFDFGTVWAQGAQDARLSPAAATGGAGLTVNIHQTNHGVRDGVDMDRSNRSLTDQLWRAFRTKG